MYLHIRLRRQNRRLEALERKRVAECRGGPTLLRDPKGQLLGMNESDGNRCELCGVVHLRDILETFPDLSNLQALSDQELDDVLDACGRAELSVAAGKVADIADRHGLLGPEPTGRGMTIDV